MTKTTGKKFGKLTVIKRSERRNSCGVKLYKCLCDCGNITYVRGDRLKNGHTRSCGCINRKHGKFGTRLYNTYSHMKERCYNKHNKHYKDYGARGIIICNEWKDDFQAFYDWSINNGYKDNLTIDRIDNNKGYSPSNCRWVNAKTQANNRRSNIYLTYNGKTQTISQWSDELGIPRGRIYMRKNKYKYTDKECLFGKGGK